MNKTAFERIQEPQVAGAPKALNTLLEREYKKFVSQGYQPAAASKLSWVVAKNAGWVKEDGGWVKKKAGQGERI